MLGRETWKKVKPDVLTALCTPKMCVVETISFSCAQRSATLLCHICRLLCKNKKLREIFLAFLKLALTVDVSPELVFSMWARTPAESAGKVHGRWCFTPVADRFRHIWTAATPPFQILEAVGTWEPISQCLQSWFILNLIQRRIISEGPLGHNGAAVQ